MIASRLKSLVMTILCRASCEAEQRAAPVLYWKNYWKKDFNQVIVEAGINRGSNNLLFDTLGTKDEQRQDSVFAVPVQLQ